MTISNRLNRRRHINNNNNNSSGNSSDIADTELLLITKTTTTTTPKTKANLGFIRVLDNTKSSADNNAAKITTSADGGARIKRLIRRQTKTTTTEQQLNKREREQQNRADELKIKEQITKTTPSVAAEHCSEKRTAAPASETTTTMTSHTNNFLPFKSHKYERLVINQAQPSDGVTATTNRETATTTTTTPKTPSTTTTPNNPPPIKMRTKSALKASDGNSESLSNNNSNEWLPGERWLTLEDEQANTPKPARWQEHTNSMPTITPTTTPTAPPPAPLSKWQTQLKGAEMHLSQTAANDGVATDHRNSNATKVAEAATVDMLHGNGNASGNGNANAYAKIVGKAESEHNFGAGGADGAANSWSSSNYQQQHPASPAIPTIRAAPTTMIPAAATASATATAKTSPTQSQRDNNGSADATTFVAFVTDNGNSYGRNNNNNTNNNKNHHHSSHENCFRVGNKVEYFGNDDDNFAANDYYNSTASASDTDALLASTNFVNKAYDDDADEYNSHQHNQQQQPTTTSSSSSRLSKGFYYTAVPSDGGFDDFTTTTTTTTAAANTSNTTQSHSTQSRSTQSHSIQSHTTPSHTPAMFYDTPSTTTTAATAASASAAFNLHLSSPPLAKRSSASASSSASSSPAFSPFGTASPPPSPHGCCSSSSSVGSSAFAVAMACNCSSNLISRCCFGLPLLKAINVRRCVLALFAITVVTIFYYTHYMDTGVFVGLIQRDTRPSPLINCRMVSGKHTRELSSAPDHRSEARLRIDPKVLVFVETTYSGLGRDIAELLVYNRIKYKIEVAGKSLPVLTNLDKGRYGVIVFENLDKYLNMDKWNRELLDKYCREYSVGIVGFLTPNEETLVGAQLRDFPLYVHTNLRLRDASLNPASPVLRLTRAGETAWGPLPGDDWAIFQHNHSTYEPIEWAQRNTQDYPADSGGVGGGQVKLPLTAVLQDHGHLDGIQRVLFGGGLRFWLHRLVFLDALSYLSHGQLSLSLERMILVDIDDIFVGERGTRLRPDDVQALIATQRIIAGMVPGFRFNLGFSGKYYHHGTREENLGDDYLLRNVQEFNWFSHMWKHQQPHLYTNLTLLMSEMQLNYAFAKEHNIPTDSGYSISPHHSGVYPAHEILYVAWKQVWNVKVTSTEEYPHLRPARLRRGFIHRNIMVLPRQTCGLFTHTMYIDRYPGGRDKLDESIQGGELFQTIVYNPINIFMTHMSNYGSDRLALYTFQSVIKFLQCWTNLKLSSAPPIQLAEMYFRLHPEEVDPVWGNPCDDPRHKKIWSNTKSCDSLPKFLVIGPQKTGTTALYTFLSMHSGITSNLPSPDTFEELQFFNGNNYYRGLDWYMDFFPLPSLNNNTISTSSSNSNNNSVLPLPTTDSAAAQQQQQFMFEKSATYFDGEAVPKRAHALLPRAKIVSILISPAKRAYSWYQHQRAHGDAIANNYSFYQVITASDTASKPLRDLRNRCLNPGKYAQHLERWLVYYPPQQLHIIDGEQLRLNPVEVMQDLQRFLKIQPTFDYSQHLRFDAKKGFFCQVVSEKRNKCLGKSKGRQYPAMDERSAKLLQRYYLSHNTALVKLLKKFGSRPIPQWLKDDLSIGT